MKNLIITESEKRRILNMHKSATSNHYLMRESFVISEQEITAEDRLKNFNNLIKKGDEQLKNMIKYSLTYPQDGESVFNLQFTAEDFKTPFSKGNNLINDQTEITDGLNVIINLYNQAKALYTDPKIVKKQKLVGTPEQVQNNLSIVQEKINNANSYLTNYNNLLPKLKEIKNQSDKLQSQAMEKPYLDAGFQKVNEINLPDGEYKTNPECADQSNLGPTSIWDLYIYDNNNKWTNYLFRPTSGSMPRSGPSPSVTVSGKKITSREGIIYYKQ
jgi:hypothetical protein